MGKKKDKKRGEQVAAEFTEHAMKQIAEQFQKQGLNVQLKMTRLNPESGEIETKDLTPEQVYKPDPRTKPIGDFLPWEVWQEMMQQMEQPGWTPARFANRCGALGTGAAFVFGIVRERIGIWQSPFPVCYLETAANNKRAQDGADFPHEVVLPGLTFVPSGVSLGVFYDMATAIRAAEVCLSLLPLKGDEFDITKLHVIYKAWEFHGIRKSEDVHAHATENGPKLAVWTTMGADVGKPEVVS